MWKRREEKDKLVENIKAVWENDHGEEITTAYNEIVKILAELDMYSANMLVNLIWRQTVKKTFVATIGKKEVGGE
jgi:hypothetical protein